MRWGEMIQAAAVAFSCTVVGIGLLRAGKHVQVRKVFLGFQRHLYVSATSATPHS